MHWKPLLGCVTNFATSHDNNRDISRVPCIRLRLSVAEMLLEWYHRNFGFDESFQGSNVSVLHTTNTTPHVASSILDSLMPWSPLLYTFRCKRWAHGSVFCSRIIPQALRHTGMMRRPGGEGPTGRKDKTEQRIKRQQVVSHRIAPDAFKSANVKQFKVAISEARFC